MSTISKLAGINAGIKVSSQNRDTEMVPAKPDSMSNRIVGGLLGTGMVAGQLPLLRRYGAGTASLYHATTPDAAESIARSGINPAYAGAGVRGTYTPGKKARINRYLMGESLNRVLEESGVKMTPGQASKNLEVFNRLMDRGVQASEAAKKISEKILKKSISSGAMTAAQAADASKRLSDELPGFGLRSYFGTHPSQVARWASGKSEGQLLVDKAFRSANSPLKSNASSVVDAVTGGWLSNIQDAVDRYKYKPSSIENLTSAQMAEELSKVRAAHAAGKKSGVIFGVNAPTAQMGYLQDFPVVRHLVNLQPGLKPTIKQFVETYEPGRDLSIPHAIPRSAIHTVDIVDHATGKIRRLAVTDAEKAVASGLGSRLKRMAAPAAIAGLGAALAYRAFRPKKRMVPVGDPFAANPTPGEKRASVASDVANVAKYVVPAGVAGTALGIGGSALARKFIPQKPVDRGDVKGQAKEIGKKGLRIALPTLASGSIGAIGGAAVAAALKKKYPMLKNFPTRKVLSFGAGLGFGIGAASASPAIQGSESGMSPEMDPIFGMAPEKVRNVVRRNPWISGIGYGAMATAVPVAGAYTLRKYYPGTFDKAKRTFLKNLQYFKSGKA